MKMESETGTLLFKKFGYHVMHNYLSDVGLIKSEDFRGELNLRYLDNHLKGTSQSQIRMRFVISG